MYIKLGRNKRIEVSGMNYTLQERRKNKKTEEIYWDALYFYSNLGHVLKDLVQMTLSKKEDTVELKEALEMYKKEHNRFEKILKEAGLL